MQNIFMYEFPLVLNASRLQQITVYSYQNKYKHPEIHPACWLKREREREKKQSKQIKKKKTPVDMWWFPKGERQFTEKGIFYTGKCFYMKETKSQYIYNVTYAAATTAK